MLVPVLAIQVGGNTSLCLKVKRWAEGSGPAAEINKIQPLPPLKYNFSTVSNDGALH
jgi:hypothetical protein